MTTVSITENENAVQQTTQYEAQVINKTQLADQIWLFELQRTDLKPLPNVAAGAHIDVRVAENVIRQYSLVLGWSSTPDAFAIAVKRDEAGRGGSVQLCDTVQIGQVLTVSAPRNHFQLHESEAPAVLIAGGIGITPIWSMIQALKEQGRAWHLHYAARSKKEAAFVEQLVDSSQITFYFDDESRQRLSVASIMAAATPETHLYCCGPTSLLDVFEAETATWSPNQRHLERFNAVLPTAVATEGFVLSLAKSGVELAVLPGQTILEVVQAAGIAAPSSCEQGICGSCETRVLEGQVDHRDAILSESEQLANNTMMICCSGSLSSRLVIDL